MEKLKKKVLIRKYLILCFFIIIIIANKIYFLLINPANLGSFTYSINTMLFFNTKAAVEIAPQAFNDWNHPGTPVYLLGFLIEKIIGTINIEKISIFLIFHHFLSSVYLIFSLLFFLNKTINKIDNKIILSTIFLVISFYNFFLQLETVDIQNYLLPTYLILITFILSLDQVKIYHKRSTILVSFFSALLLSIKLNTLPIFLTLYVSLFVFFLLEKNIKFFFKYLFLFLFFFLLVNLPIIGRLPKIIFNNFFSRNDTLLSGETLGNFLNKINLFNFNFYDYLVFIFYLIVTIFFIFVLFKNLKKKNNFDIFLNIISIFLIIFFFYTMFLTFSFSDMNDGRGVATRNSFLLFSFLIFGKVLWNKNKYTKFKNFILLVSFTIFLINNFNYITLQKKSLENIKIKNIKFQKEYYKYFSKSDTIAIYNTSNYGFRDFCLLSLGNEVFVRNAFTKEMIQKFPKKRHLNANYISSLFEDKKNNNNELRKLYDFLSVKFSEYLPDNLNHIFNMKSYNIIHSKFNEFYLAKNLYSTANQDEDMQGFILFDNNQIKTKEVINYLNKNMEYNIIKILIDNDTWWFLKTKF